jgi:hypothetical protein
MCSVAGAVVVKPGLKHLSVRGKVGCSMLLRVAVLCAGVLGAGAAFAEELGPEQARAFVVGKLFAYNCFDGTVGMGRILDDGSVIGTIRPGGRGEMRFATLPPNTLRVESGSICAHLSGLPIEPCFRVQKIDYKSFRGSVSGFGFAYCDFQQHNPRAELITHSSTRAPVAAPIRAIAPVAGPALAIAPASAAAARAVAPTSVPAPVTASPVPAAVPASGMAEAPVTPVQVAPATTAQPPATAQASVTAPPPSAPGRSTPIATLRPAIED